MQTDTPRETGLETPPQGEFADAMDEIAPRLKPGPDATAAAAPRSVNVDANAGREDASENAAQPSTDAAEDVATETVGAPPPAAGDPAISGPAPFLWAGVATALATMAIVFYLLMRGRARRTRANHAFDDDYDLRDDADASADDDFRAERAENGFIDDGYNDERYVDERYVDENYDDEARRADEYDDRYADEEALDDDSLAPSNDDDPLAVVAIDNPASVAVNEAPRRSGVFGRLRGERRDDDDDRRSSLLRSDEDDDGYDYRTDGRRDDREPRTLDAAALRRKAEEEAAEIRRRAKIEAEENRHRLEREAEARRRDEERTIAARREEERLAFAAELDAERAAARAEGERVKAEASLIDAQKRDAARERDDIETRRASLFAETQSAERAAAERLEKRVDARIADRVERELGDRLEARFDNLLLRFEERFDAKIASGRPGDGGEAERAAASEHLARTLEGVEEAMVALGESMKADTRNLFDDFAGRLEARVAAVEDAVAAENRAGAYPIAAYDAHGLETPSFDAPGATRLAEMIDAHRGETGERFADLAARVDDVARARDDLAALRRDVAALRGRGVGARRDATATPLAEVVRNALPTDAYAFNVRLANDRRADCLIKLPYPPGPIAVDAKFPADAFASLDEGGASDMDRKAAAAAFQRTARAHVDRVAAQLISPGDTADSALMYVPSEAAYAELHAQFPDVVDDAARARVWIVSPASLTATLHTIRAVLRNAAARDGAREMTDDAQRALTEMETLRERMASLEADFDKARRDVRDASASAAEIHRYAEAISAKGRGLLAAGAQRAALDDEQWRARGASLDRSAASPSEDRRIDWPQADRDVDRNAAPRERGVGGRSVYGWADYDDDPSSLGEGLDFDERDDDEIDDAYAHGEAYSRDPNQPTADGSQTAPSVWDRPAQGNPSPDRPPSDLGPRAAEAWRDREPAERPLNPFRGQRRFED